jgi:predicted nucleic acid-binding protein
MKRVFLDATCWMAAAGSPTGGSAEILKLGRLGRLGIVATQRVLREAEKNIGEEWGAEGLERFHRDVADLDLELIDEPTSAEEARWQTVTVPKDCHVLAGACKAGVDMLVTLDRKHLLTERVAAQFPLPVMDTRQFFAALTSEDLRATEPASGERPSTAADTRPQDAPPALLQAIEAAEMVLMILEQSGDSEPLRQELKQVQERIAAIDLSDLSDPRWARVRSSEALAAARAAHAALERQLADEKAMIPLLEKAQIAQAVILETLKQALLAGSKLAIDFQNFGAAAEALLRVMEQEELI